MTDPTTDPLADDVYATDLASAPRGDGLRDLVMTDRWNTPLGRPNGGYILAAMLRGLAEEIGASDPLVAAITYHSAPENGPAEISTRAVRMGRRVQTGDATLVQGDRLVAQLTASFGPRTEATRVQLGTPPSLGPPDRYPDPREHGMPTGGIFDRVDYRLGTIPGFFTGTPSGEPVFEIWQRRSDGRIADFATLAFLCDSFAPPVLELGGDVHNSMTVQLTVHFHRLPTTPWVGTRLSTRHVHDGFHEEDCELWDEDGNLLAQSRQLAMVV